MNDTIKKIQETWFITDIYEKNEYPKIVLIAAVARNKETGAYNVLGKDNKLAWDYKDYRRDMNRFKEVTTGHVVLMGRKTFESIGSRPLPKRMNLVVSSQDGYLPIADDRLGYFKSIESALQYYSEKCFKKTLFVIGGQTMYEQFLPYATHVMLTHINLDAEGDVFFPELKMAPPSGVDWTDKHKYWRLDNVEESFTEGVKFVDYCRPTGLMI